LVATFRRLFVANRGEVAARIARTCDRMGIAPVFGVSEADRAAPYTEGRDVVVLGPARSSESYLDAARVVQAALQSGCTALHPGWGFLSENPLLATLCESHGVTFIGPPAHVMQLMGKKTPAKRAMAAAGLSLIPGSDGVLAGPNEAAEIAERIGYPVLLKAESGGGGRGMRIARGPERVEGAYLEAKAEALAAFGDDRVYLEKLIERGRHVEVQILADRYGNAIHVGERDCTVQRNHQKLIEESPAIALEPAERARTLEAAVRAAAAIGYVGAGTMEFLLDEAGRMRFMEMNTRLQVEHCVSEMRSGLDLVELQIQIASGHRLPMSQDDLHLEGHAIECRINAEDPSAGFRPSPGVLRTWKTREDPRIRVDTHVRSGYEVPPFYDSLIAKVIVRGDDREDACERMIAALEAVEAGGIPTTIPMHLQILRSKSFRLNAYHAGEIPGFHGKD
jgi:acetyl-CoA carboxylase biotin carboxylase subunit